MVANYPDLFTSREHALNHLYCVIGNGYEWQKGRIVKKFSDTKYLKKMKRMKDERPTFNKKTTELINELKKLGLNYPEPKVEPVRLSIYPISEYSKLYDIPKDVQADFLQGAWEVIKLIFSLPNGGMNSSSLGGYDPKHNIKWGYKAAIKLSRK